MVGITLQHVDLQLYLLFFLLKTQQIDTPCLFSRCNRPILFECSAFKEAVKWLRKDGLNMLYKMI